MTNQPTNQPDQVSLNNVATIEVNTEALINIFTEMQAGRRSYYLFEEEKAYKKLKAENNLLKKTYKRELAKMKFTTYNYLNVILENEKQTMQDKTNLIIDSFFEIIKEVNETKKKTIKSKQQKQIDKLTKERNNIFFEFIMKTNQLKSNKTCMICLDEFKLYELKKGCYRCSAVLHVDCLQKYNETINHHNCENKNKINLYSVCIDGHEIIDHCPQCKIIREFKLF